MKICSPIKSSQNIINVIIKDDLRDIAEVPYEAAIFNLQSSSYGRSSERKGIYQDHLTKPKTRKSALFYPEELELEQKIDEVQIRWVLKTHQENSLASDPYMNQVFNALLISQDHNHFHILKLFDLLTNFAFMRDYYLIISLLLFHGIYQLPNELPNDLESKEIRKS